MNILFTCAGRRTYLLQYFKQQLGDKGLIVATDMQLSAPALTAADIREQVPAVYSPDYIERTLDICRRHGVGAIISLNDLELPILAANRMRFESEGVRVIVSSPEVIDICFDKYRTAEWLRSIGLDTPRTYVCLESAEEAISCGELSFPLVLKPRWGSCSIGIEFVNNPAELRETYAALLRKVKDSILASASTGREYILIQEKITGQEYGLDIMNDLEGRNRGVAVKKKLAMRAGETDKAVTVDDDRMRAIGRTIGRELGHIGNLDVDVFESNGRHVILELNPRFGGGFPFSYEAGANLPGALISWLEGTDVPDSTLEARPDMAFAKCDRLVAVPAAATQVGG